MTRRSVAYGPALVGLALTVSVAGSAGAQWRTAPSGVTRATVAGERTPASPAAPSRYRSRGEYAAYGAAAGVLAGFVTARFLPCPDCWVPYDILTAPVGALVGVIAGASVWDYRYAPPRPRAPNPAPQPGLARYMILGAAAGGAAGAGATYLDRCADCSAPRALAQNVPVGAAVGAIGGALVYGVRRRGR